jgi:DNA topoisomerase VI subunit B
MKMYHDSEMFQLRCVISGVDGNEYCVRDRSKVNEAADLLAETTNKCSKVVQFLQSKKPNHPITKRLVEGYNPDKIRETLPTELSHIATVSIGHTPEYWSNFKFILERAVEYGLYDPVDYKNNPTGYCGMTISDSPFYDH